jgi:CRISPR-associated protein Cmr2
MSKHLFLCSIGPVQEFIATARRSRDLWYGSWVLSELSKSIAKCIVDQHTLSSLVSPYSNNVMDFDPGSDFNAPNRVTAIIENFKDTFADTIEVAFMGRLVELRENAFGNIKESFDTQTAIDQVSDLPEFFWVAVPFESDQEFPQAREKAEVLLAARKNNRVFKQLEGSHAFKSSLDGVRESVIPSDKYPQYGDKPDQRKKKIVNLYRHYHARQGEQLSGVDLLKRWGAMKDEPEFPSTSDLAGQPFMKHLETKETGLGQKVIKEIRNFILATDYGWENANVTEKSALLFESRLLEYFPDEMGQKAAKEKLNDLLSEKVGNQRPYPYYALLIADGDNMGKIIDAQKHPDAHRKLSNALSKFAKQVPDLIAKDEGACIYAGGEDILAYLPLDTVLGCAAALEAEFVKDMAGFSYLDDAEQHLQPTLSGAIVIAHHLTPLSDVLKLARSAETDVKQTVPGKNGLAIILSKRSGSDRIIMDKWAKLLKRFDILIDYFQRDAISSGTAYELQQLHLDLEGSGIDPNAVIKEALRIVARKQKSGGRSPITKQVQNQFTQWIEDDQLTVLDLSLQMIIAKEFAKQ